MTKTTNDPYQEVRLQKAMDYLDHEPDLRLVLLTEEEAVPGVMVLTIAIRGLAAFEMHMKKEKYDPWTLMNTVNQHCGTRTG